jgi:superfamily I DNA/RNA helicase
MENRIELSDEQKEIVMAPLRGRQKITAFAGAAKTTTMEYKARHLSEVHGMRGLYLAFNKSAQLEAESRFGDAALARTPHSMAFRVFGKRYSRKLGEMRPRDLVEDDIVPVYPEARAVLETIHQYCISADTDFPSKVNASIKDGITTARSIALGWVAKQLWDQMCDPQSDVPMTHDGYLKLYQLSNPRLPGDYLMVDEFQDTNPVTMAIVKAQPHPVIVVGDPYQSIYAFRGAINAMRFFKADSEFSLTHSFRFGPAIADLANKVLHDHFAEKRKIVGAGAATSVFRPGSPKPDKYAILSRTNAELFEHAVHALECDLSMSFIGGVKGYNFERLRDAQLLAENRRYEIRDSFIRSFSSLGEMEDYAEEVEDYETARLAKIARSYGAELHTLVPQIISNGRTYKSGDQSDRVMSTAHKSKGATLDYVVLCDDFKPMLSDETTHKDIDEQEVNLAYMAATRPRYALYLNEVFCKFLERNPALSIDAQQSLHF